MRVICDICGITSIMGRALPNPGSSQYVEEIRVHLQHQSRRGRISRFRSVCSRVVFAS